MPPQTSRGEQLPYLHVLKTWSPDYPCYSTDAVQFILGGRLDTKPSVIQWCSHLEALLSMVRKCRHDEQRETNKKMQGKARETLCTTRGLGFRGHMSTQSSYWARNDREMKKSFHLLIRSIMRDNLGMNKCRCRKGIARLCHGKARWGHVRKIGH